MKNIVLVILLLAIILIIPVSVKALPDDATDAVELTNPLAGVADSLNELIGVGINELLGIIGSIALVMFIYGGLTFMLSAGSPEKVQKGKTILVLATIGLVIIFSSYAIARFILEGLGGKG